ncbi:PREDICTED: transmembrane protease serine 11B, partial [Condylura cristata]|uniref:transmembrane protease serine 11B n=1 Tax=Condylura cristata TaxID=143302 RepID=UPI0003344C39
RYNISSQGSSWPLWRTILIFLGVAAILGVTIGLLVYFLAVAKIYYYQVEFHISGVTYNISCENAISPAGTNLNKDIETKMSDAFQNSNIYKEYISSQVIKLLPLTIGSTVQLLLTLKFPPAKRNNMKAEIEPVLHQMLQDNMASWNAVPASIKLTEMSKANAELLTNNCCGMRLVNSIADNRIVNGKNALLGVWPWQASLQWKGLHFCGASLISRRWLLTAAHCFANKKNNLEDWTVNFGISINKPVMTRKVQNIISHENYNEQLMHNDIALMELAEEVSFTKDVRKICLPDANLQLSENDSVVVTGWGRLSATGPFPVILRQAFLKIIDNKVCSAPGALYGLVTDTMLCAGFMSGKADACLRDSGGPLAYPNSRNIWHLVGIVSWGSGCGEMNRPGVYTRVTSFRDWITAKTGL